MGGVMIIGGLVEVFLGINAERKPLEQVAQTPHRGRLRGGHAMTVVVGPYGFADFRATVTG